jgi:hypothetical protein
MHNRVDNSRYHHCQNVESWALGLQVERRKDCFAGMVAKRKKSETIHVLRFRHQLARIASPSTLT